MSSKDCVDVRANLDLGKGMGIYHKLVFLQIQQMTNWFFFFSFLIKEIVLTVRAKLPHKG